MSSTLVISPGDDSIVLGYGVTSTVGSNQYKFMVFSSDNSSWSLPYHIAHLGGPEGIIDESGNFTAYNDSITESALAITSANARFVFVWGYNQTILYRTWSAASGASQIYSVSCFYYQLLLFVASMTLLVRLFPQCSLSVSCN